MRILQSFAALSLASGAMMALLPEGSLRKTAGMVVGLLMLLCWAEGIAELLGHPIDPSLPATILAPTAADVEQTAQAALALLHGRGEALP